MQVPNRGSLTWAMLGCLGAGFLFLASPDSTYAQETAPPCTSVVVIDSDDDGVPDGIDNCPNVPNPVQQAAVLDSVGTWHSVSDTVFGVYVADNYAYLAIGWGGLRILDVSDPASPFLVGTAPSFSYARDVQVAGDIAFVPDRHAGLSLFDVSDPSTPTFLDSAAATDYAGDVQVCGNYAYIAASGGGLDVMDVSDLHNASRVANTVEASIADGVHVVEQYVYVASHNKGLVVIDVTSPTAPTRVGQAPIPFPGHDVQVVGGFAYVGAKDSGLQVLDVSDPTNPHTIGSYSTSGRARGVFVTDFHAYVADENLGLQILNVSDPSGPALAAAFDSPGKGFDVHVSGQYVYLADEEGGLHILRFDPWRQDPAAEISIDPADIYYGPDGCSVPVSLSNLMEIGGVTIPLRYDLLPPGWTCDSVSFLGGRLEGWEYTESTIDPLGQTVLVEGVGTTCVPPDSGALFYIWFSNPLCTGDTDSLPYTICVDTTTLDVPPGPKSLLLADCSIVPQPVVPAFEATCIDLYNFMMVDVNCDCQLNVLDVVFLVNVVFRGAPQDSLCVYAAADLNCDTVLNVLDVVLMVNCVFRGGDCIRCGCDSAPTPAAKAAWYAASGEMEGSVSGERWETTLRLTSPLPWVAAQLEWTFDGSVEDISVTVDEGVAGLEPYWHLDGSELTVGLVDIYGETTIEPGEKTILHLSGTGEFPGLRLTSGLLATPDAEPILIAPADLAGTEAAAWPSTFMLGDCYPNPFNAGTVIPYTLAEDGEVHLEVFDVLGRRVAALVDEFQSAGQYDIAWDGLDDRGQPLASGMYFYRLTAADIAVTKKMVLLK